MLKLNHKQIYSLINHAILFGEKINYENYKNKIEPKYFERLFEETKSKKEKREKLIESSLKDISIDVIDKIKQIEEIRIERKELEVEEKRLKEEIKSYMENNNLERIGKEVYFVTRNYQSIKPIISEFDPKNNNLDNFTVIIPSKFREDYKDFFKESKSLTIKF